MGSDHDVVGEGVGVGVAVEEATGVVEVGRRGRRGEGAGGGEASGEESVADEAELDESRVELGEL